MDESGQAAVICSVMDSIRTVILCGSISAKFDICTVVGLNGTLVETNLRTWGVWDT